MKEIKWTKLKKKKQHAAGCCCCTHVSNHEIKPESEVDKDKNKIFKLYK